MCAKFWFSAIIYAKVTANNSFPQVNALVPGLKSYSKKKTHSNFMEKIIVRHMGQRWEQRSLLLSQISLWLETVLTVSTLVKKKASLVEKVYRSDDIFSLWDIGREQLITHFFKKANSHHATINFTAEISENKISFLDTIVYKAN